MYDAVFSALMTLMGLSFAAIGLLLQAQEKHWVRHAHIWRSIRPNLIWSGVVISVSSFFTLVNMGSESNSTYSLTWWMVLLSFVVSLVFLGLLIRSAVQNLEVVKILERMSKKYLSDELSDVSKTVGKFFTEIKQLLTATLDVGDLTTYGQILDTAIVGIASPEERTHGNNQITIRDAIENQGEIACQGLSELRVQIDFSVDNQITARAVSLRCLVATKQIVNSWVDLDPEKHKDQKDASAVKAAQKAVIEHAVKDFGYIAEFLLSTPRPSLSLVTAAADIGKSISSDKSEVVVHDSGVALDSVERVLTGAQRALSAGYSEEALTLLDAIRPWLDRSWKFIPTLVRLSVVGQRDSNEIEKFLSELFDGLQVDSKTLSAGDIGLLAPVLVEALSDLSGQTQPKLRGALYRLVSRVASAVNTTERIRVFLDSVEGANDEIVQQFVQRFILDNDVAPNHSDALQKFFRNHIESYGLELPEAVEKLCQWVYYVGRSVAKSDTKSKRLDFFQRALINACRAVDEQADVSPIVCALNAACAIEERDRVKDTDNSEISYRLPNPNPRKRSPRRPTRSHWNNWVEHCYSTMKTLTFTRRNESLSPGFSNELGRRFLVSIAHLVIDLESEDPDKQWAVLLDEKVLTACELALSWKSWDQSDFGDVSRYLSWMRDSAALVFGDSWPAGRNEESLRKRWYQIFLLCNVALASLDNDLSESNSSVEHQNWLRQPNILDDLRKDAEELISEYGADPQGGAPIDTGSSYENFVKKSELVTAALAESRNENPEEDIPKACETVAFTSPELKAEFCARLLTAVAEMRIPKWADETRELSTKCAIDGDAKNAYYLLRVVRSCLRKDDGGMVFHPKGLSYVFNKRGLFNKNKEGLTSKDSAPWIFDVVEALARDWLAYKYKEDSEESKKKVAEILTSINDELNRLRVTSVPKNFRTSIREWSKNGNSTPHTAT